MVWVSVPSWIPRTWWTALAVADFILTILFTALKLFLSSETTFEIEEFAMDVIPDLKLIVLSAPAGCASSLNL